MSFPVNARPGSPYKSRDGKTVSIIDTVRKISDPQTQAEALNELGIEFSDSILTIEFIETGKPYTKPKEDRTKIGEETTEVITVKLPLQTPPPKPLDIKASLSPFIEDGVNFAGKVCFQTITGEKRCIPMIGRGTAALEGRENDAHAGFCVGGTCASFQERVALILAVAAAVGVSNDKLQLMGQKLQPINNRFHGREEILLYSVEASQTPYNELGSYTEFMRTRYPEGNYPLLLESMVSTQKPNKAFYQKALTKMTPEELENDRSKLN
ncbi:MAG: hypothetical protein SW833_17690 [Cyanobacteriota bacterium]|nr:hypothetical protein [Cyanobacteriota bacterium]